MISKKQAIFIWKIMKELQINKFQRKRKQILQFPFKGQLISYQWSTDFTDIKNIVNPETWKCYISPVYKDMP